MNIPRPASLTPAQREALAVQLQQRRVQLEQQVLEHQQGHSRVDYAAELLSQDGDDAPQRDADREVALERADRHRLELGQVSQALARIHLPDYGQCSDCGEAIAPARLALEPWALRCVVCESAHEGWQAHHTL